MKRRMAPVGYTDIQVLAECRTSSLPEVAKRSPRTILQQMSRIEGAGHKWRAVSWPDGTAGLAHWSGVAIEPPDSAVIAAYREALSLAD